ncbi:MAG: histidine kinase N-terminal 7TM domain-containing protein [Candidatus Paceibacterota bacterium]|jgi:hypothetical protein
MDILTPLILVFIVLTLFIGIFVYFSNKKSRTSLTFLFFCLFAAIWMTGVLMTARPISTYIGNLGFGLSFFGICFLAADFMYFVQIFPEEKYLPKWINIFFISSMVIIGLMSVLTDLVADKVSYSNGVMINKTYGPLYPVFAIVLLFGLLTSITFSVLKYKELKETIKKRQASYFLVGIFLSFILTVFTNLMYPMFKLGSYEVPQYGPLCFSFFIVFSAVAILRYRLFDIKIIMTEILVGAMGFVLLFLPFLMSTNILRILAITVFIVFCLIGYLLIKASLKEIKNSETLEQKVKERTGELEKSEKVAEEAKKVAEERAAELERWYKLTIGREVRMAELKDKIKELENK